MATTTTIKSKRFSFAGFFNKPKAPSPATTEAVEEDFQQQELGQGQGQEQEQERGQQQEPPQPAELPKRRAQKTQSLYIKSFRQSIQQQPNNNRSSQYDPTEAHQSNHNEVKSQIRRSLSAVLYATPQKLKQSNKEKAAHRSSMQLVPVLVTQDLSDLHGGMIMAEEPLAAVDKPAAKREDAKGRIEYDNTLDVCRDKDEWMIVWQGYGYCLPIQSNDEQVDNTLFEKEIWTAYRGLIHPLHIAKHDDDGRWAALDVTELKRYFDNYGSMLLRLREASMKRQQHLYHVMDTAKSDWIVPE